MRGLIPAEGVGGVFFRTTRTYLLSANANDNLPRDLSSPANEPRLRTQNSRLGPDAEDLRGCSWVVVDTKHSFVVSSLQGSDGTGLLVIIIRVHLSGNCCSNLCGFLDSSVGGT